MSALEQQKNPDVLKRSNNQNSLAEKASQDEISLRLLITQFSTALGEKFEKQFSDGDISFDVNSFRIQLTSAIENVYLDSKIPDSVKGKFKYDLMGKIDLLAQVQLSDIDVLRKRRNIESLGLEAIEMFQKFGNNEAKIRGYYLGTVNKLDLFSKIDTIRGVSLLFFICFLYGKNIGFDLRFHCPSFLDGDYRATLTSVCS